MKCTGDPARTESASIPLVGLTTYQAFVDILNLRRGQKILIHAGSGGVGTFAIQPAKLMGAFVATTASDKGYERVKSLGADLIINYKIDRVYALQDAGQAFRYLEGGSAKGKVVIRIK